MVACQRDSNLAAVRALLERGASLKRKDRNGWTALSHAVENGAEECISLLLEAGSPRNSEDSQGRTALMLAAVGRKEQSV